MNCGYSGLEHVVAGVGITQGCDWGDILCKLPTGDDADNDVAEGCGGVGGVGVATVAKGAVFDLVRQSAVRCGLNTDTDIAVGWLIRNDVVNIKTGVVYFKSVVSVGGLSVRARAVYDHVISMCPCDDDVLKIKQLIDGGPFPNLKISGRTIDTLVTRFPKCRRVCYYLDVTDKSDVRIVDYANRDGRTVILFDIGSSYRKRMHQFSKSYFDCFGRGNIVRHTMQSGEEIDMSLCQFTFFIWADRFRVFDFLRSQLDEVVIVRQRSQKSTYKPRGRKRRNPRKIRSSVSNIEPSTLYPIIIHTPKYGPNPECVVMRPRKNIIYSSAVQMGSGQSRSLFAYPGNTDRPSKGVHFDSSVSLDK